MTTDPLTRYIQAVLSDGDYLNDWLTHLVLPPAMYHFIVYFGWFLARLTGA